MHCIGSMMSPPCFQPHPTLPDQSNSVYTFQADQSPDLADLLENLPYKLFEPRDIIRVHLYILVVAVLRP